jgi:regulator of replication initiation timing
MSKTHTPIIKAKDLLGEYNAFQKNQLNNLGEQLEDNVNSLSEMRAQVFDLITQIEQISLDKENLKNQLHEAKKPQQFYGSGKIVEAGNKISEHYYKLGYKLDCLDWTETLTGYTITYGIRNNPALTEKELLADNLHEQLAAYTTSLKGTLPAVEFNRQNCTLVLTVQLRPLVKKEVDELSDEAINRLARSWDTWKKHAKKWNRIRITGGSGAGKSPLTERIVSEQLQHKKVKGIDAIKLYNPQAGSRKDNWSFPSVGKTHRDSIQGIEELTALCRRKYQGSFGIWIFDEVDSTIRQAPGKQRPYQN